MCTTTLFMTHLSLYSLEIVVGICSPCFSSEYHCGILYDDTLTTNTWPSSICGCEHNLFESRGDHTSGTCMHACMQATFPLTQSEPSIHKLELLHPSIHQSTSLRWPACNILTTHYHINRHARNLSVPSKYYYTTVI